jgi:hypothetical protein
VDGGTYHDGTGSSFTASTGTHTYSVEQTDVAGNTSSASSALTVTLDTTAAAAPTLALATDSGTSNFDGITNVATVNVTGLESGATWQYSIDGGTYHNGIGNSFTASSGAHSYTVEQTDAAGNTSSASSALAVTFDTTPPTLTITSDAQGATATGVVTETFTFSEPVTGFSAISVALSAGTAGTFTTVDSSHYTLSVTPAVGNGSYNVDVAAGSYTDKAGNSGATATEVTQNTSYFPSTISLGSSGNLTSPETDNGNTFYNWKQSYMDDLVTLFAHSINDAPGATAGSTVDESNHYAWINGVHLSLPTAGDFGEVFGRTSWAAQLYWTSTPGSSGQHECSSVAFNPQILPSKGDWTNQYVALQVL